MTGTYAISKFGLEAFNDTLRQELAPHGIHVSLVVPGPIKTPLLLSSDYTIQQALNSLNEEGRDRYGDLIGKVRVFFQTAQRNAVPPQVVADAVERALESRKPKTRYLVTKETKMTYFLHWVLPDRAWDFVISKTV